MSLLSKKTLVKKILKSKSFRETYVFEQLKRSIPFQIRTMRTEREWSQAKTGEALGKPQNVISRLESPAYGKLTLQTLQEIARGFDVGLIIKFVPFSRLVKEYEDVSFSALSAVSVSDKEEAAKLEAWAADETPVVQAPPAHETATPARHLRVLNAPVVTTAVQRTLPFNAPKIAVVNNDAVTPNRPTVTPQSTSARLFKAQAASA